MTERETLLLAAFARQDRHGTDVPALAALFGSVENLFSQGMNALRSAGVAAEAAHGICGILDQDLAFEREMLRRTSVAVVPWDDTRYPEQLHNIPDRPAAVFIRGDADALAGPSIAIVGTRRATRYGRDVGHAIATSLARRGVTVVSGLAFGIDATAHAASLEAGGRTAAVLASGVDAASVGPRTNAWIAERAIGTGGVLVSEYPPTMPGMTHRFPRRNRIIAALAAATVVVQAPERSGALITAKAALEYGKDVLAVPGPITDPACAGTNALIAAGAIPICATDDVAAYFGLADATPTGPALTAEERAVLEASHADATVDDIAARTGLPPGLVLAALGSLELAGRVRGSGGAYRRIDNAHHSPLP